MARTNRCLTCLHDVAARGVPPQQPSPVRLPPPDREILAGDGHGRRLPRPSDGERFGDERLRSLLISLADPSGTQRVTRSIDALAEWAGEKGFVDDMSLVVIEWAGP